MSDENQGLDAFISADNNTPTTNNTEASSVNGTAEINLEDEFAKLLNDFVNQNNTTQEKPSSTVQASQTASEQQKINTEEVGGLDSLLTPQKEESAGGLDGFAADLTSQADNGVNKPAGPVPGGLDDLITNETPNISTQESQGGLDNLVINTEPNATMMESVGGLDSMITPASNDVVETKEGGGLKEEESELAQKIKNFQDSMSVLSMKKNLKLPKTDYVPEMLIPNYKPSTGKKIAEYLLASWDIINKYAPEDMKKLPPDADDEGYLSFAETLNDTDLQLAIISYVEILIDIEICEVSYEQKKEIMVKNRIKRELYEEYMELQERKKRFIAILKEKNFPIDVDRLMNNYFRVAQKDPDSSFEALTKNPAMFSPIQMEKIKPKFFGLIKVTPEDGIKANQKIGAFIKKLKV